MTEPDGIAEMVIWGAAMTESPIRDLMRQIDTVVQAHIAYPQVADAITHLRDHLSALARCEEINSMLDGTTRQK